jgi:hypothetical protein
LIIQNSWESEIRLSFYNGFEKIPELYFDGNPYRDNGGTVDVENGFVIPADSLVIIEYVEHFGPPKPYNPFTRYNRIVVEDSSGNELDELGEKDFTLFQNGKYDFIYFLDYYPLE